MSRATQYIRDPQDGSPVNGVTVSMKKHIDDTTVASDTTDVNGRADLDHDTVGYPGPVYLTATSGGTTRVVSGNVWGQLGGLIWPDDIPDVFRIFNVGLVPGIGSNLAATGTGSDRVITIASGMAMLRDGIPYRQETSRTVTLDAGDSSNPRIDRIVLRLTREGQTEQGKIELTVVKGSPGASPVAPDLTQDTATWDTPLYQVAVAKNATTISTGNITADYPITFKWPDTSPNDLLRVHTNGILTRIPIGTNGQVLTVVAGVPTWAAISSGAINATSIADGSVTNTEFQYINSLTSNAQTQLNAKAPTANPTFTGNATFQGPIQDDSSSSWTCTTGANMGSSPGAQSKSGNEYNGRIVQTTGGSGTAPGLLWTIAFDNARPSSDFTVLLSEGNSATRELGLYVSSTSTTGFTIACVGDPPNSTSLRCSWFIVERA